ncbi:MAG: CRISPR-associated protein Csx19 [Salinibacter sp.]
MSRSIEEYPAAVVRNAEIDTTGCHDGESGVRRWLESQAALRENHHLSWLLAHADDGVVWGRVEEDGALVTSHEAAQGDAEALEVCPPLRTTTLQQARLFGRGGELLLWRDGARDLHARLIYKADGEDATVWEKGFDEQQMLWGKGGRPLDHDFFFWSHGAEGLRHALPFRRGYFATAASAEVSSPPRLRVRHYLNSEGLARVAASRLVGFSR